MMMKTLRRNRGAAAIETVLMLLAVVATLALCAPLAGVMREQLSLGRAAGRAARFASSVPDNVRSSCTGVRLARRPSVADVSAEATCARFGNEPVPSGWSVSVWPPPNTSLPGTEIQVTVRNTVDLGPLGSLLAFVGVDPAYAHPTLSSRAVFIEE